MLSLLGISNFAIIDQLEIEFDSGFTVMTGETGAGKSILVDAVGLALGDRADSGAVRSGARRADITLSFDLATDHPAQLWLADRGLDDEELCCLRRTISAEGRSRAFVNNQPVTLKDLRALGELLVDIHGQHAHQSLLAVRAQRELLDSHGELTELANEVATAFREWRAADTRLQGILAQDSDTQAQLELLRFQLGELETLNFADGEPESLRQESSRLRNMDRLQQAVGQAAECLYESDAASASALTAQAVRALEGVAEHDPVANELLSRLNAVEIELREAGAELSRHLDQLDLNPARLDEIESRLDRLRQIARRHRTEEDQVPALTQQLRQQMDALDSSAESLAELEQQRDQALARFDRLSARLSSARSTTADRLSAEVTAKLRELGMPDADFRAQVKARTDDRRDASGRDDVEFLVSTNPGQPPDALSKVASGGELSRIGLALAVVAADASPVPCLIFDEVDSGIGGAVAEVVGRRLQEIASHCQVLCVTHLPQVASQGNHHFRIAKLTDGKSTRTQIRQLDQDQRIEELSRMLGGVEITAATRAHAAEMIKQAAGS